MTANTQTAPYPDDLADLVEKTEYRRSWRVRLYDDYDRGQGCVGLTLVITTWTVNSYNHDQRMGVNHLFAVPAASYNRESWRWWLFECFALVEKHECMEFFTVDGEKPYAPNHGPGWDPYLITVVASDIDRRTSFRGEINS